MELSKALPTISALREKQFAVFQRISQQQNTCQSAKTACYDSQGLDNLIRQQDNLREAYQEAYTLASEEMTMICDALEKLKQLIKRRDNTRKNKRGASSSSNNFGNDDQYQYSQYSQGDDEIAEEEERLPERQQEELKAAAKILGRGTGTIGGGGAGDIWTHDQSSPIAVDSQVAALVDANSIPKMWIQATIMAFRPGVRPKYEVIDSDEGSEGGRQKKYILDTNKVIPLPSLEKVPLNKRKELPKGTRVLAIFPSTTVFYPAIVAQPPKKKHKNDVQYSLIFEEDEGKLRQVNADLVCPLPEEFADELS